MHLFVGNDQDKHTARIDYLSTIVMRKDYAHKDLLLSISKQREAIFHGLLKYEVKTKMGVAYGELRTELEQEIYRLTKNI